MQGHSSDRYDASGIAENQFEPGSGGRVLKNLLGITSKREMDIVEAREQLGALLACTEMFDGNHHFNAGDVCSIHKLWLEGVYSWAGRYRQVNIGKGGLQFAAAAHIPKLMNSFEKEFLARYTPCAFNTHREVADALAKVHVELVLIHPFRDGNGRATRMLASLMAMQAGLPSLDFGALDGKGRNDYFAAVRSGMKRDYEPMIKLFLDVIDQTVRHYVSPGDPAAVERGEDQGRSRPHPRSRRK
jgi:cell filamentation protein